MSRSILNDMFRAMSEACNGRIRRIPNTWVFKSCAPKHTTVMPRTYTDDTGREIVLVNRPSVHCSNLDLGDYPKLSDGRGTILTVPYSACLKCEYRGKPRRGIRYPYCEYIRQKRGGAAGAAKEMLGMMNEATQMAQEMIGR